MSIPDFLQALLTAHGPSGYEATPAAAWRAAVAAWSDDVQSDTMGTSWARVPGTGDGPTVALVGHIDEIGLIVTHIDDKGNLRFIGVGGWDPQVLIGQRVVLATKDGTIDGVIGKKPIHLIKPDERKNAPELKDLHIDIGAADGDEAREHVRIGDVAVIAGEPVELLGGRIASRSMDNRLGCYVVAEAARLVHEAGGAAGDVIAVAAVQEEVGLNGARAFATGPAFDLAVAVDVTHATDAPGVDEATEGRHPFGSGPVISRGTTLHPVITEGLIAAGDAKGIDHTLAGTARGTGTDADAIFTARGGTPTGLISIPLRYMHSPVEVVQLSDVQATAELLAEFVLRLPADVSFVR